MSNNNVTWEYCAMRINLDGTFSKLKFFNNEGNHKLEDISDAHMEIAKLGEAGWELVTFTQITNPDARVYYLKRQIS